MSFTLGPYQTSRLTVSLEQQNTRTRRCGRKKGKEERRGKQGVKRRRGDEVTGKEREEGEGNGGKEMMEWRRKESVRGMGEKRDWRGGGKRKKGEKKERTEEERR